MRDVPISMGRNQQRAFTKIELLVIVTVMGVLGVVLFASLVKQKQRSQRISCVSRLKNIGLSFRIFSTDSSDDFPMTAGAYKGGVKEWMGWGTNAYRIFQSLSNEISTSIILICPADTRNAASTWQMLQNTNISYFVGVDAVEEYPERILAGDRNLQTAVKKDKDGFLSLNTNDVVTWSPTMHGGMGNVVLADGSVQQVDNARLHAQLQKSDLATNRFMLPD